MDPENVDYALNRLFREGMKATKLFASHIDSHIPVAYRCPFVIARCSLVMAVCKRVWRSHVPAHTEFVRENPTAAFSVILVCSPASYKNKVFDSTR